MPEDISVQILSQASENIQKLFDLSTRIDERVKAIQAKQDQLDKRIDDTYQVHISLVQKIAVLEARDNENIGINTNVDNCSKQIVELDKRLAKLENESGNNNERWKSIAAFIIQLIWVILAAYLLTKMNLQPPAVP